ncbi:winged helix-turn-helix domain-containing protein [Paraburkholderia sp. LEh10]|uniref:winged helix-turn-helix domain-containing protein n=1 Tax=Paraburkholderia sp. LEh10 TaxID=2821353 RepID=UPI001AE1CA7C|nr:winged helix-turn-helix domain-containing protein [Paraburkholderia sp. LEh10]MBP0595867.1 winged helix-turn-helix domain-containing protein [Paraburkholderia sp. LEh10]
MDSTTIVACSPPVIQIGQCEIDTARRILRRGNEVLEIGSRAFDILVTIASASGRTVTKDEMMASVWPTTVVEENNIYVHLSALRKVLGADAKLIVTVPGRGYRLVLQPDSQRTGQPGGNANVENDDDASAADGAVEPVHRPLPARIPKLIGRQDVLDGVQRALRTHRTVTLTGTGGIGKTRLAIEVAHRMRAEFPDGVVFVPLAAACDAQSALDAFAYATGSRLSATSAGLEQIAVDWRDREALVVLDNCEQVLDTVAAVAEALADASSRTRVLATSREALRVRDELVYQVPPLTVPASTDSASDVLRTPAVRFFLARAQADGAHLSFDETSVRLTGEVCRRLDGIPLALELAASRAAVLGIGLLAANLDDRFRILTGGWRTALPRHQTLKATLDWSYGLLSKDERKLLRWLGMFVNGFTLDMACAMAEHAGLTRMAALDAVTGLVSRSLLVSDPEGPTYRYRLLETTRAYALQQLDDNGERFRAAGAHATLFLQLAEADHTRWIERPIVEWLRHFTRELGNVRAALEWTLCGRGDPSVGIALAAVTVPYLYDLSLVDEGYRWARAALRLIPRDRQDAFHVSHEARLRLVSGLAAALIYTEGPLSETREAWMSVLNESAEAGRSDYVSRAHWGLWNWSQYAGHARDALTFAQRFGDLARSTGNETDVVLAARIEGVAHHYAGDQSRARQLLERMIEAYDKPLDRWRAIGLRIEHGILARATLARVLWLQGHREDAYALAARSFDAAVRYDYEMVTCYVLVEAFVPIALLNGDPAAAKRGIDVLNDLSSRFGFTIWRACCSCYDAWVATLVEPGRNATERLAAATEELCSTGFLGQLPVLRCQLGKALMREGRNDEALNAIDIALLHCDQNGNYWHYNELCRVKGAVLRRLARRNEAQSWFATALDFAKRNSASRHVAPAPANAAPAPAPQPVKSGQYCC